MEIFSKRRNVISKQGYAVFQNKSIKYLEEIFNRDFFFKFFVIERKRGIHFLEVVARNKEC